MAEAGSEGVKGDVVVLFGAVMLGLPNEPVDAAGADTLGAANVAPKRAWRAASCSCDGPGGAAGEGASATASVDCGAFDIGTASLTGVGAMERGECQTMTGMALLHL